MIDLGVVSMGDSWAIDILNRNITNAGVPRDTLNVVAFINGPVDPKWRELCNEVLSDSANHGFPVAANEILHHTKNSEIVLVDDDVAHAKGWLAQLVIARSACLKAGRPVGLGGIPLDAWRDEELGILTEIGGVKVRPRATPIGGCRHIGRDIVERFGYICEGYFPCGGDDVDFCNRLAWAGMFNYHIEAVRSKHEHHERDDAYKQAKADGLLRIARVDAVQQDQYRQGMYKYTPTRPWLFA